MQHMSSNFRCIYDLFDVYVYMIDDNGLWYMEYVLVFVDT
jgi:hypothetical protein